MSYEDHQQPGATYFADRLNLSTEIATERPSTDRLGPKQWIQIATGNHILEPTSCKSHMSKP